VRGASGRGLGARLPPLAPPADHLQQLVGQVDSGDVVAASGEADRLGALPAGDIENARTLRFGRRWQVGDQLTGDQLLASRFASVAKRLAPRRPRTRTRSPPAVPSRQWHLFLERVDSD